LRRLDTPELELEGGEDPVHSPAGRQAYPPGKGQAYPGKGQVYPAKGQAYPGKGQAYRGKGQAYPAKGQAYPGKAQAQPGKSQAYPGKSEAPIGSQAGTRQPGAAKGSRAPVVDAGGGYNPYNLTVPVKKKPPDGRTR